MLNFFVIFSSKIVQSHMAHIVLHRHTKSIISIAFITICFAQVLNATPIDSISSNLLSRYQSPADSLKRKAAEYLISGLPAQWHYATKPLETSGNKIKVMDTDVIDADYLAENIEYAFKAWSLPWAKDVSFEDFCRYILPYKMGNEEPERWRQAVWEEYSWVLDRVEDGARPSDICRWVNASVRKWYTIHLGYNYPSDAGYLKAKEIKEGSCQGASLMILYPLRALGVCAVYDYVPQWGNRSDRHSWDALYENGNLISFNAPETDPGKNKLEFIGVGRMRRRRPKILRKDYLNAGSIDVTSEYIPTVDITIHSGRRLSGHAQLMVFDNSNWRTVCDGDCNRRIVSFKSVARDIVFLPVEVVSNGLRAISWPVVVDSKGKSRLIRPHIRKHKVILTAKYPEDKSNAIFPGERYELFYWNGYWKSLGSKVATDTELIYRQVPKGALLWLRNLDKGKQERIFIYEGGEQIWY